MLRVDALEAADIEPLWLSVQQAPQMFPGEVATRELYDASMRDPSVEHWVVRDGVTIIGLLSVSHVRHGWDALFHQVWFDRVLDAARLETALAWALRTMWTFDLQVGRGFVPANRTRSLAFTRLGMREDGRLRLGWRRADGSLVDLAQFSMTPAEVEAKLRAAVGQPTVLPSAPKPRRRKRRVPSADRFLRGR